MAIKQLDRLDMVGLETRDGALPTEVAAAGVAWLKQQLVTLRSRLDQERAEGIPELAALDAQFTTANRKAEQMAAKIAKTKSKVNQRKAELAEWKRWYDAEGKLDKSQEHDKLLAETLWRSEAIVQLDSQITQWESEQLEVLTAVAQLEEKIEMVKAGVYELPVDQDPRIVELKGAIAQMENAG